jgi:hypothetical protein
MRLVAIALVAACSGSTKTPVANTTTPAAPRPRPPAVVVQLALRGTFGIGPPWSRVPPFTLLDDGTLLGADEDGTAVVTHVSLEEVEHVRQTILGLGFERLRSYTDSCMPQGKIRVCASDGDLEILRVRLPSGELREVQSYNGFSEEPELHQRVVDYLSHYKHPQGVPFHPTTAALHVRIDDAKVGKGCPAIDPALLDVDKQTRPVWGMIIDGRTLETVLAVAAKDRGQFMNRGQFIACAGTRRFLLALAPGIPGVDLSEELEIYQRN